MPQSGYISNADLSTSQYYVVRLTGTTGQPFEVAVVTAITDRAVGILLNDPTCGQGALVSSPGEIVRGQYGAGVTGGAWLAFGTDGRLIVATAPTTGNGGFQTIVAHALEDGVSGEVHYVLAKDPMPVKLT